MERAFMLPLEPVPAARLRLSRYGAYYPKRYRAFLSDGMAMVANLCEEEGWLPLYGSLEVWVDIFGTRPKTTKLSSPNGDIDNFAKGVLDCCNESLWFDDKQIVELHVTKEWHEPGVAGFSLIPVQTKEK